MPLKVKSRVPDQVGDPVRVIARWRCCGEKWNALKKKPDPHTSQEWLPVTEWSYSASFWLKRRILARYWASSVQGEAQPPDDERDKPRSLGSVRWIDRCLAQHAGNYATHNFSAWRTHKTVGWDELQTAAHNESQQSLIRGSCLWTWLIIVIRPLTDVLSALSASSSLLVCLHPYLHSNIHSDISRQFNN